jgi:hypothetical protein
MTLGRAPLARRQSYYGVGQLEQRPVGKFLMYATVGAVLIVSYMFYNRWLA